MVANWDVLMAAVAVVGSNLVLGWMGRGWPQSVERAYYGFLALGCVVLFRFLSGMAG